MNRPALRLAAAPPTPEPDVPVTVAVAGRTAVDQLVRLAVDRHVVALVPSLQRPAGVDVLNAAARAPESTLEIVHLNAAGIGARYLEAVARRAAGGGWTRREIVCLVAEAELRMTVWMGRPRRRLPGRATSILSAGRWRPAGSGSEPADELLDRGLSRGSTCLAALSGSGGRWARGRLTAWRSAGAVAGRFDGGLARALDVRWSLELVVAPTLTAGGLSALREQVAAAPRCGWCRLPVLGSACPRCAVETRP